MRDFPPGLVERLNLTDEQKTQIETLREKSRADGKAFLEKVKNADVQLKTMFDGGNFDEAEARKIVNQKSQAFAELEIIHLRCGAAIRNVLNDEQKAKLSEIKSFRPEPPPGGGKLGMPPPLPPPPMADKF